MKFQIGDIFQVRPDSLNEKFRCSIVVATDIEHWGIVAYVKIPGQGIASTRLPWDEIEFVGKVNYLNIFGIEDEEMAGWIKVKQETCAL